MITHMRERRTILLAHATADIINTIKTVIHRATFSWTSAPPINASITQMATGATFNKRETAKNSINNDLYFLDVGDIVIPPSYGLRNPLFW